VRILDGKTVAVTGGGGGWSDLSWPLNGEFVNREQPR